MYNDDAFANLVSAVLRINIQAPEHSINSRDAGAVFNELQKLLDSMPDIDSVCTDDDSASRQCKYNYARSSPIVAQDILEIRNRMNMDQKFILKEACNSK